MKNLLLKTLVAVGMVLGLAGAASAEDNSINATTTTSVYALDYSKPVAENATVSYNFVYDTRAKEFGSVVVVSAKPWHNTLGIKGLTTIPGAYAGAYFNDGALTGGVQLAFPFHLADEVEAFLAPGIGIKNGTPFSFSVVAGIRF